MRRFLPSSRFRRIEPIWAGYGLTALWFFAAALFFWFAPGGSSGLAGGPGKLILVFSLLFPVALIWAVVFVAQALRRMRKETAALRSMLENLGKSAAAYSSSEKLDDPDLQGQLAEIASLTRQTDTRLSALASQALDHGTARSGPNNEAALQVSHSRPADASVQPALPLNGMTHQDEDPITIAEFVRALDFPKTADDKDGFRIMRRAKADRQLAKLLDVTQELLTAMSEDGIYMDDLHPDLPMARVWRRFANGERGLTIGALGGIRDRTALTLVKARMKSDPDFRDRVHHFLREFDGVLRLFERSARDNDLNDMATSRTARAFMLLGRVAGTFD